jgi:uncharacterized hydantoinase/oxoprolinase family protein
MGNRQLRLLRRAVEAVSASLPAPPTTVVTAGSGEFLAARTLANQPGRAIRRVSLAARLGPEISQAACAYALAILTAERINHGDAR